jgi:U3 small nucleolar RNA-associated protein 13
VLSPGAGSCIGVSAEHNFYVWNLAQGAPLFQRRKLLLGFNDEIISVKCFPQRVTAASASASDSSSSSSSSSASAAATAPALWSALATNSEQIRLLQLQSFDAELLCGHTDMVLALDLAPCGSLLVSGAKDRSLRLWDVSALFGAPAAGKKLSRALPCLVVGQGHTDAVAAVAFSRRLPKGVELQGEAGLGLDWRQHLSASFFVSGSKDRTLKLWNMADVLRQLPDDHSAKYIIILILYIISFS